MTLQVIQRKVRHHPAFHQPKILSPKLQKQAQNIATSLQNNSSVSTCIPVAMYNIKAPPTMLIVDVSTVDTTDIGIKAPLTLSISKVSTVDASDVCTKIPLLFQLLQL